MGQVLIKETIDILLLQERLLVLKDLDLVQATEYIWQVGTGH